MEAYVQRLLGGSGADASDPLDEWADDAPVLAGLAAASVQGRAALGPRAGARVRRRGHVLAAGTEPPGIGPCHAHHNGFDLHAGLCVPADQRARLERICQYALRPPVAQERLQLTDGGHVQLELRRPWADGTTHLLFEPVGLLERLAVLTPRPRINLILYYGVLGPRAAWRSLVVKFGATDGRRAAAESAATDDAQPETADRRHGRNYLWAELMRRSMGLDVTTCPRCGGRLRLIAVIDDPAVWSQSMRLYLGAALLEAGRAVDAEAVFRRDLEWNQQNGWATYGLYQALLAQEKAAEAAIVGRQFQSLWRNADVVLERSRL